MIKREIALVALACAGFAASANAAVTFTFFDPAAGFEIQHTEGSDNDFDPGHLTWVGGNVTFTVDGSDEGLGVVVFDAEVAMDLNIGAVTSNDGGKFLAPILNGDFSFTDANSGELILSATVGSDSGAVLALGTTGNIIAQGDGSVGGLLFEAGEALASFLNGLSFVPVFDANFTLTGMDETAAVSDNGFLVDFSANSAFTGTAQIPTPGTIALAGLSVVTLTLRRKRS